MKYLLDHTFCILVLYAFCTVVRAQEVPANGSEPEIAASPLIVPTTMPGESGVTTENTTITQLRTRYEDLEHRFLHQLNNSELADYLALKNAFVTNRSQARDEMGSFARRSVGQTYRLNAVQFDLTEGDCVSFVNRTLALSLASDYTSYSLLLERIRHKDGVVNYRNRNFSTLGDWLPNNAWLLRDLAAEFPPGSTSTFTHIVRPKLFEERPSSPGSKFTRIIFKGSDYSSPNQEVRTESFVPTERIPSVLSGLQTGDVILVLRQSSGGHLGCDHLGLIVKEQDNVSIIHCAPPGVLQERLTGFLERCSWIVGLKFLRLHENARDLAKQEIKRMEPAATIKSAAAQDEYITRLKVRRAAAN